MFMTVKNVSLQKAAIKRLDTLLRFNMMKNEKKTYLRFKAYFDRKPS